MNHEVLEQLKQEYNETLKRMQDLGDIIAHCAEIGTSHCGQDADMDDACCQAAYDPNESQPVDVKPAITGESLKDLLGMEVMFVFHHCHKCGDCTFREGADGSECPCVKVELVGGDCLCLAKRPVVTALDEEEDNVMDDIKEKTEAFLDYLDSVVKG